MSDRVEWVFRGGFHRVAIPKSDSHQLVTVQFPDVGDPTVFHLERARVEGIDLDAGRPLGLQFLIDPGDLLYLPVGEGDEAVSTNAFSMIYVRYDADVADLVLVRDDLENVC